MWYSKLNTNNIYIYKTVFQKYIFLSLRSLEYLDLSAENYKKNMFPHSCAPALAIQSCDTGQRVFYDSWQLF